MTAKYHINPETGEPGKCSAETKCRFAEASEHYGSPEIARIVYEQKQPFQLPLDWSALNRRGIKNIENPDILARMDGRDMGGMHLGNLAVAQASHYTQPIIGWLRMAVDDGDQEEISKLLKELDDTNIREAVESISSKNRGRPRGN